MHRRQPGRAAASSAPDLRRNDTLTRGRNAPVDRNRRRDTGTEPEAPQPGAGQDDGLVAAAVELADARVDVAANRNECRGRKERSQLRHPAHAAGADRDRGPRRHPSGRRPRLHGRSGAASRSTSASRGSSRGRQADNISPSGSTDRQILGAVHADVDPSLEQRLLELLHELALAVVAGNRPCLRSIAGRGDDDDLGGDAGRLRVGRQRFRPATGPAGCRAYRAAAPARRRRTSTPARPGDERFGWCVGRSSAPGDSANSRCRASAYAAATASSSPP